MGEIKSAIELAMERTSNLSLSAEEKARQKKADLEKLLQGALQQYYDGILSVDGIRDRINELQEELKVAEPQLVTKAVLMRIDPDRDNEQWMALVAVFAPALCDPLQEILSDYREQRFQLSQATEKRLRKELAKRHGVTGLAVTPNPDKDAAFQDSLSALKNKIQARIDAIQQQTV